MDLLTVPHADTSLGLRHFSVAGPRVRNQLPHELRQVLQVKAQDILLPPLHGQLAPQSGRASDCVLGRRLRSLNKF